MKKERVDHTLQPTALINAACMQLLDQKVIENAGNRRYLFAAANQAMRQILVDHARKRNAAKRGGDWQRGSLDVVLDNFEAQSGFPFEELDAALLALEQDSPRQREVVEHRFFGGLSVAETAALLDVSEGTVERDWRLARIKLYGAMKAED
jgi:RNA polymerase sigma factor (TIGR02999 family)